MKSSALLAGAGLAARFVPSAWAQPQGANAAIRVAVIGLGIKGAEHLKQLLKMDDIRIVALCDVDPRVLGAQAEALKASQISVVTATDMRKLFERPDIDAVIIATGTHWHALATIWACQAGKDVYVEKPVSHTAWEGRRMIEEAARQNRIVQVGTQFRSDSGLPEAIDYVRSGRIGKIQWIHTLAYAIREPLGRRLPWYPDWLDYGAFCGPAPMTPLERARLHYDWHFQWATGNGDLANMGIHMIDIARRFAQLDAPPRRVLSLGGRYGVDDVGETPNTQLTVFDYESVPVLCENRALPAKPGVRYTDHYRGLRNGIVVQCEGGYYAGYFGGGIYDNAGKSMLVKRMPGDGGASHLTNFFSAVRSRRPADLAAPLAVGHASTIVCHYGNISYRLGQAAEPRAIEMVLEAVPASLDQFQRVREHLTANAIDLGRTPLRLGPWVYPAADEGIAKIASEDEAALARARYLLRETQRAPFAIPERA